MGELLGLSVQFALQLVLRGVELFNGATQIGHLLLFQEQFTLVGLYIVQQELFILFLGQLLRVSALQATHQVTLGLLQGLQEGSHALYLGKEGPCLVDLVIDVLTGLSYLGLGLVFIISSHLNRSLEV